MAGVRAGSQSHRESEISLSLSLSLTVPKGGRTERENDVTSTDYQKPQDSCAEFPLSSVCRQHRRRSASDSFSLWHRHLMCPASQ